MVFAVLVPAAGGDSIQRGADGRDLPVSGCAFLGFNR